MSAYSGRAAGLPDGSVVADADVAYIRRYSKQGGYWRGTDHRTHSHDEVDLVLGVSGELLRVGDGR